VRVRRTRSVFVVAVTAVVLALGAGPAAAAPSIGALNQRTTGPFAGTTEFDFSTPGCGFAHQVFDGTYRVDRKAKKPVTGSFHLDTCVSFSPNPSATGSTFLWNGTFTLDPPGRGKLTGIVSSRRDFPPGPCGSAFAASLNFRLRVQHATGPYAGVRGKVVLRGTWCSGMAPDDPDPITGRLAGRLRR
jgi:hypothetical protein